MMPLRHTKPNALAEYAARGALKSSSAEINVHDLNENFRTHDSPLEKSLQCTLVYLDMWLKRCDWFPVVSLFFRDPNNAMELH